MPLYHTIFCLGIFFFFFLELMCHYITLFFVKGFFFFFLIIFFYFVFFLINLSNSVFHMLHSYLYHFIVSPRDSSRPGKMFIFLQSLSWAKFPSSVGWFPLYECISFFFFFPSKSQNFLAGCFLLFCLFFPGLDPSLYCQIFSTPWCSH